MGEVKKSERSCFLFPFMEKAVNSETMLVCSSLALAVMLELVEAAEMCSRFLARDCISSLSRKGMSLVGTPSQYLITGRFSGHSKFFFCFLNSC